MEASLRVFAIVEINIIIFENSWISMKINKLANHPKYLPGKQFHRNRMAQSYIPALQGENNIFEIQKFKNVFRHYL